MVQPNVGVIAERETNAISKSEYELPLHHVIRKPLQSWQRRCRLLPRADAEKSLESRAVLRHRSGATHSQERHHHQRQPRHSHRAPPDELALARFIRSELLPRDPAEPPSLPDKSQRLAQRKSKQGTPAKSN